jgi:hypothetical protein
MRKLILRWLFDTDDIKEYIELLHTAMKSAEKQQEYIKDHIETLKREKELLEDIGKFITICKNHGIDIDEEMKNVKPYEVDSNDQ